MPVSKVPGATVITGEAIHQVRRVALAGMLSLEIKGMRRSRPPSAYAIIKKEFRLRGSRQSVLTQFKKMFDIGTGGSDADRIVAVKE